MDHDYSGPTFLTAHISTSRALYSISLLETLKSNCIAIQIFSSWGNIDKISTPLPRPIENPCRLSRLLPHPFLRSQWGNLLMPRLWRLSVASIEFCTHWAHSSIWPIFPMSLDKLGCVPRYCWLTPWWDERGSTCGAYEPSKLMSWYASPMYYTTTWHPWGGG